MPGTDDRLRAELERFVRPADPSGVFEAVVQRRARRETIRKLRFGVLAVAVVTASGVGFVALSRVFRVSPVTENRSSASVSVHPSTSPTYGPGVTNVGLAFPLCNVSTFAADFDGDGARDKAYLGTKLSDVGSCPSQGTAFTVLAIDVTGDGRADATYGPLDCQPRCSFLAGPDLAGDGRREIAVASGRGFFVYFHLFAVEGGTRPVVTPITRGSSARHPMQFPLGGTTQSMGGMYCTPGHLVVVWSAAETAEGNGPYDVGQTTFRLVDASLMRISGQHWQVPQTSPDLLPQRGGLPFGGPKTLCGTPLIGRV